MLISGTQAQSIPEEVIRKAFVRIATLRIGASDVYPQLGEMIHGFIPVAVPGLRHRPGCGGFAMDKSGRFYFDPELILDPSLLCPPVNGIQTLIAIYLHEVWHWARQHPERIEALAPDSDGKRQPHMKANCAADAELHGHDPFLRKHMPVNSVWPESLKHRVTGQPFEPGETMEHMVRWMEWEEEEGGEEGPPPPPGDEPGEEKGKGKGDIPDPNAPQDWLLPPPGEDGENPGIADDDGDAIRKKTARNIQESSRERGSVPGHWEAWAGGQVDPPKIPWTSQLNRFLREVREVSVGASNYTYRRRSRRAVCVGDDVVLPASFHPKLYVALGVDTSGSFSDEDLLAALGEAMGIFRVTGNSVFAAAGDTRVCFEGYVSSADKIDLAGRGGTDMRVILKRCARENPHVIVLFTDGHTPWPRERDSNVPVIVCLIGNHCGPERVPDFMHTVVVD